jgi:predicted nucleic acid-binding protein
MNHYHVDANILIRLLRGDDVSQTAAVRKLFESAAEGRASLILSAVTFSEVYYALRRSYKLGRVEVAEALVVVLESPHLVIEHRARLLDALQRTKQYNIDFGDAYLAAAAVEARQAVVSFDRDFRKIKDVELLVP